MFFSFLFSIALLLASSCAYYGEAVLDCGSRQFWPHESDCNLYYQCSHGIGILRSCPSSLVFDDRSMSCNWPDLVDCTPGSNATATTSNDAATATVPPKTSTKGKTTTSAGKTSTTNKNPSPSPGKKIICYYTNWARYRNGKGQFTPADVDPFLCTHIVYSFALLNANTHLMELSDPWTDIDSKYIQKINDHKRANPNLKCLLAIGGWTDSSHSKYSQLIADPAKRAKFISHAKNLLDEHGFDGLDLDWEYPGSPQGSPGNRDDYHNFAVFVAELKSSLAPKLLTSAVAANPRIAELAYHPSIFEHLDWVGLMAYDYHGPWAGKTGYAAPLYSDGDPNVPLSVQSSVNYYLTRGCPPEKLILGIPTYGHTFRLDDPAKNGIGASARSPGLPGPYTGVSGFMAYYEVLEKNWTIVRNFRLGSYAYSGNQWVSFEDPDMCKEKVIFAQEKNLGGVMFWTLDFDTFQSRGDSLVRPYDIIRTAKSLNL